MHTSAIFFHTITSNMFWPLVWPFQGENAKDKTLKDGTIIS